MIMNRFVLFALLCLAISRVDCSKRKFHLGKIFYDLHESLEGRSQIADTKWFKQHLDHFQPLSINQESWKQRYFTHSEYFDVNDPNAPVFLEIGGEGRINAEKFVNSYMVSNLAKKFKAYSIQLEHRFYGESQPFSDLSTKHLRYLNSEQALADLANFIQTMNSTNRELQNRQWIVFGGSYPGSLSAWMRLKYPHLVAGSIASSAPVQAQLDFPEYMEVVHQSLGPECSSQVKSAFLELDSWIRSPSSATALIKLFNLCDAKFDRYKTRQNFLSIIIDQFAGVVQYNEDNRAGNNVTIDMICEIMTDSGNTIKRSGENVIKLSQIYKLINKDEKKCNNVTYENSIEELKNVTIDFDGAGRQWMYQTCNEFGYYQTTTSPNQPFPNVLDLKFFTDQCAEIYGSSFNEKYIVKAVERTNMIYGGRNLKADKILLLNGSIDPWHALSLLNYQYLNTSARYIKGTAHCADMYAPSPKDKLDLIKARELIANRIELFLNTA